MAESREMHNPDAAAVWDRMWRSAPVHIDAYAAAKASLDKVPPCG